MDAFTQDLLMSAMQDDNVGAKALVNYMFREIVEDIHAEGKITDEEMEQLNREACNRAALFWNEIMQNRDLRAAFLVETTFDEGSDR